MSRKVSVACIGAGNWGMNLVRQMATLPQARLISCCDARPEQRELIRKQFPSVPTTDSAEEIFQNPDVEGVVLATNARTHFELAKQALTSGKHLFVEKPLTLQASEASELVELAKGRQLHVMVGHLMLYHPALEHLKGLIQAGELGEVLYLYTQRVNLGTIRSDESALWCFGPHDFSMLLYLLEEMPDQVRAFGQAYLRPGIPDVVFVGLSFPSGKVAQCQLSWLDPNKIRKLTVVGRGKMAVFDDMEPTEKLRIYDKGVTGVSYRSYGEALNLRFGDIHIPKIPSIEPLRVECEHFINCISQNQTPKTNGEHGAQVVQILEAAQASLDQGGIPQPISPAAAQAS